jgi:hypothetical protein
LPEAFDIVRAVSKLRKSTITDFLLALKQSRHLSVQFPEPDRPEVGLRSLRVRNVARVILQASANPLTPEEILAQAQAKFGSELIPWAPICVGNRLTPEEGFYLLGPRSYGLRVIRRATPPLTFARLSNMEHAIAAHEQKRADGLSPALRALHEFLLSRFKAEIEA